LTKKPQDHRLFSWGWLTFDFLISCSKSRAVFKEIKQNQSTCVSSPLSAINRFRRLAAYLAEAPGAGDDGRWFSNLVLEFESGAPFGAQLDDLAGLRPPPGGEHWWQTERRMRRDALLRDLAATLYPANPRCGSHQAEEIAAKLQRYEASQWLRDRPFLMPPRRCTRTRALLFMILKANPRGAPSARTIERALASI
jgi:hypothetical protein